MIKLFIKLNDSDQSFEIAAKRGGNILSAVKGNYQKDLADKLILGISDLTEQISSQQALKQKNANKTGNGLDKNLACVRLKKRGKFRVCYEEGSKSFVSNLIGNSVVGIFNWLEK